MKAHEWVPKFKADFKPAMMAYIEETRQLLATRKCSTPAAIEGVIREQRNKWKKIVQYVPDTDEYLFDDVMEACMPEAWKHSCDVETQRYLRKNLLLNRERTKKAMDKAKLETDPTLRLAMVMCAVLESIDQSREIRELCRV